MLNRISKGILLGLFSVLIVMLFSSCSKEKETVGVIIVKKSNGSAVEGAIVRLHQDGQQSQQGEDVLPELSQQGETDEAGRVQFIYDLEAVLNVDVVKYPTGSPEDGNDTLVGSDVIRLLRGKIVTKTIKVN